jgi:hypothetical protein
LAGGKMKNLYLFVALVFLFGCGASGSRNETNSPNSQAPTPTKKAPVVIEGRVVGGGTGDKYYYYDVQPTKVLINTLDAKLDEQIKVARVNYESQPVLHKEYILSLDYYNEAHPEHGFKIVTFKEK